MVTPYALLGLQGTCVILSVLHQQIINPALEILGPQFADPRAKVMLLAIAQQESGLRHRIQQPNGPARSYWQFERGGGVRGIMRHGVSSPHLRRVVALLDYKFDERVLHLAMTDNDLLAACMARLLLYTVPRALPTNAADGWEQYLFDSWRPGKPHPATWGGNYRRAETEVLGG